MNVIDIIVGALLIYALWRGWHSGILVQLGGIVGIVLGSWLAFRFSEQTCQWFSLDASYRWLTFVAILIVVMVAVIMMCKLLTRLLENGGLSLPIKLLGAVLSMVKILIILALIMQTYESLNSRMEFTKSRYLEESYAYKPLERVSVQIFPYINSMFAKVEKESPALSRDIQQAIESQIEKEVKKHIDSTIKTEIRNNKEQNE